MPPSAPDTVIPAGSGPVSGAASGSGLEDSRRSRKPANTKFKQQQLPAWQPMLTARSVLPFLVAIGVAFIPIGIALYLSASNVTEITLPYTDCLEFRNEPDGTGHGAMCRNVTVPPGSKPCSCREKFTVTQDVVGPVFIYYALDNFFQNHRKYVKSRDDAQLMGNFVAPDKDANKGPSSDCAPFAMANNTWGYAPCGAIANSLFNDTIKLNYHGTADNSSNVKSTLVGLLKTGIAWTTDKKVKFRNPDNAKDRESLKAECDSKRLTKPPYWDKELWDLDKENFSNNGLQNEDLIVWMRTAAFPSFRKLYRRINHTTDDIFQHGLPAGNYSIDIEYKFPVTAFDGKKYVIISSVSWIGGKNPFLGIAYMTVGSACLLLAAVFFFIHVKWGKKPSDMMNVNATSHW